MDIFLDPSVMILSPGYFAISIRSKQQQNNSFLNQYMERKRTLLCDVGFSSGRMEMKTYIRIGAKAVG
jgi:hypothetical protein